MTAPRVVRLTLPLPPNRANARGHWRKVQAQKQAYFRLAVVACRNQGIGYRVPWPDRESIPAYRLTAKLYVWGRMDDDNCVARLKWPLDVMTGGFILRDDKRPHCVLSGIPEQFIDRKNPRVEIELTELTETE